jgi:hypothetical protein
MCRAPRSVQRTHAVWRVVWSRSTRRPRGYRSVPGMRPNKATSTSAEAEPYVQFQRTRLRNAARSRIGPLPIAIAWAAGDVPSHSSRPPSNPAPRRPALHGRYLELQGAPRGGWTCSFAYQPPTNNIFLSEHHQPTVPISSTFLLEPTSRRGAPANLIVPARRVPPTSGRWRHGRHVSSL